MLKLNSFQSINNLFEGLTNNLHKHVFYLWVKANYWYLSLGKAEVSQDAIVQLRLYNMGINQVKLILMANVEEISIYLHLNPFLYYIILHYKAY